MTDTYTQCRLRIHGGMTEKTAWIPTRYARSGSVIEIGKRLQGRMWDVVSCGTTLDAEYVEEHERDYRTQREASDI